MIDERLVEKLERTPDEISNPELTKLYLQCRSQFRTLAKRAVRISRGSGGIPSSGNRMYWASVLFTRLTVSAKSIDKLLPDPRPKEHWDFSAVASLVRNFIEAYLLYFWLCEDDVADEVRDGRFICLYLHDHGSRKRLFVQDSESELRADQITEDLTKRFYANPFLAGLPAGQQKNLLRGERTPFVQDEVLESMRADKTQFRWLYRFLSQHTHTGPVSFYRMVDIDRGTGVETRAEKVYMIMALSLANSVLESAIKGHLNIFPDAESRPPHITNANVIRAVESEQGRRKS